MAVWTVYGYRRTDCTFSVEAETAEDAVFEAKAGNYFDVDTEPGPDLMRPAWHATPALKSTAVKEGEIL
jgi:hypothetical protein